MNTEYGFRWGPVMVARLLRHEGRGYVLGVSTEHSKLEVFVTEKGRKIRVWRDGRELS